MTFEEDFFMQYETLKISEDWVSIVNIGNAALEEGLDPQNNALINARLASSLFYLGKKQETLEMATYTFGNASLIENKELEARGLYLISAAHRSLGAKEEALSYIHDALAYVDNKEVAQITKLKILFNSGALYQDLNNDPAKAIGYYTKALEICQKINEEDDCNRTKIRSIRATLELGDVFQANKEATELAEKINLSSKTGVHFLLLRSKISYELENYVDSARYAMQGLEIAQAKQMQTEVTQLNELIDRI